MTVNKLKGFPPKVFIIGAQKAGTTQLCALLDQHPEICLSSPKEPDFFTRHFDKGLDWYKQCFSSLDEILIDASTSYTSRPLPEINENDKVNGENPLVGVPERMHQCSPDAKLIYIVRDPVKRAYSGYWHQVTAGYENKPLCDAIESDSSYRRISKYAEQLQFYLEFYDPKNILILEFEELIKNPESTLSKCFEFINLTSIEQIETGIHKNKSFQLTGFLGFINQHVFKVKPVLKLIRKVVPNFIVEVAQKLLTKSVPKINAQETKQLRTLFEQEVDKVKQLIKQ